MTINLIGMPLFYGCDNPGVEKGPQKLRENNLLNIFEKNHSVYDMGDIEVKTASADNKFKSNNKMKYLDEVVHANLELANKVYEALESNAIPVVIGGDHSLALGSIAGVSKYYGSDELAVVWVDAHGDINTSCTSPSGNIHGMPLAASMNIGDDSLTTILFEGQKVKPENVFILAARDLDKGEVDLISKHNLNVWDIKTIRTKGLDLVIEEFLDKLVKTSAKNVHFSFDIDCLDPEYVPGTGTPVEEGLTFLEGKQIINSILETKLVKSLDFVEFNPALDKNERTLETCVELLKVISKGI